MDRFLAECDEQRRFDGGGLIGEILRYLATDGFSAMLRRIGLEKAGWDSVAAFRARHIVKAVEGMMQLWR